MESNTLLELASVAGATVVLSALFGALLSRKGWSKRGCGAAIMAFLALIATGICVGAFAWRKWTGLSVAIPLVTVAGAFLGSKLGKRRGGLFVALLWLGYCVTCAVGYWAAGWVGWLSITLPSVALFWYSLWRFSGGLLPLQMQRQRWRLLRDLLRRLFDPRSFGDEEQRERRYRYQSLRALLTYSLGTNYPYYVVENGELKERVGGNVYKQFFAGPGIVITDPHQAAVITDGMEVKEIGAPGLTLTDVFDRVDQIVDLRTQLKAFHVEALTEDGIRIRVLAFVFFKILTSTQPPGKFWIKGESDKSILQVMRAQPVEKSERRSWDDLVPMVAQRILQDIISQYCFDELCARDQSDWPPHEEITREVIRKEFTKRLKKLFTDTEQPTDVKATKYEGIQIVGAGIANLEPVESSVMQRRIENWRTEWTRKMMTRMGEGATEAMRLTSQARAQGQAEVIRILTQEAEHMDSVDKDILADVLTLRLLEALESMARRPPVQQLLPPEATETMKYLRRTVGKGDLTNGSEAR